MARYLIAFVAAVVIGGFIWGAYQYPEVPAPVVGSPVGSTFGTSKIAQVNITPSTAAATSSSILNTDSSARWVKSNYADCIAPTTSQTYLTGAGLANLQLLVATTSVANEGLQGSTNYAGNLTVATTSYYSNNASSTLPVLGGYWAPGTYLTFDFNATNTAQCTVGVRYEAS